MCSSDLAFAEGFDTYGERARTLVTQAAAYAGNQVQARESIPSPQQLATAEQNVRIMQANNIASGGKYAAPLAQAVANKTKLNNQAVTGYSKYHASTDADTGASDPGDPAAAGAGGPGKGAKGPADQAGQMAGEMAQMIPSVLGAVGGMAGGLLGAVAKAPETLMQAASQAASQAAQGMKGLGDPKLDAAGKLPDPHMTDGAGGTGGGAGGGAGVSPAGGVGPLSVAPSTGSPSAPAVEPAGASGPPAAAGPPQGGQIGRASCRERV